MLHFAEAVSMPSAGCYKSAFSCCYSDGLTLQGVCVPLPAPIDWLSSTALDYLMLGENRVIRDGVAWRKFLSLIFALLRRVKLPHLGLLLASGDRLLAHLQWWWVILRYISVLSQRPLCCPCRRYLQTPAERPGTWESGNSALALA